MTAVRVAHARPSSARPLALLEARRFARHPLFLVAVLLGATASWYLTASDPGNLDRVSGGATAIFVGILPMLVAYFLTTSARRSREVAQAAPTSATSRTAALCWACAVPALVGVVALVYNLLTFRIWPLPAWAFGTLSPREQLAAQASGSLMAAVGGPLLGVAAGRWLRFRGAATVLVLGLLVWVVAAQGLTVNLGGTSLLVRSARLFTPFAFFNTASINPDAMDTLPGSPWWFVAWQVALCVLAALAALLRDAEGPTRARLVRAGAVAAVVALLFLSLAITGGTHEVVRSYPDGTTSVPR